MVKNYVLKLRSRFLRDIKLSANLLKIGKRITFINMFFSMLGWQLIFTGYGKFVSVDDVKFVNCSLPPDRGGQCKNNEIGCSNGACVSGDKVNMYFLNPIATSC